MYYWDTHSFSCITPPLSLSSPLFPALLPPKTEKKKKKRAKKKIYRVHISIGIKIRIHTCMTQSNSVKQIHASVCIIWNFKTVFWQLVDKKLIILVFAFGNQRTQEISTMQHAFQGGYETMDARVTGTISRVLTGLTRFS